MRGRVRVCVSCETNPRTTGFCGAACVPVDCSRRARLCCLHPRLDCCGCRSGARDDSPAREQRRLHPLVHPNAISLLLTTRVTLLSLSFAVAPSLLLPDCLPAVRPLNVRISSLRRPFSAGKRVQVACESSGSRPPAVLTWWLGAKQLTHAVDEVSSLANTSTTTSTLHFTPSVEDNGKVLSCRADHSILPDSALEDSWLLDIYCECHSILFLPFFVSFFPFKCR